MPYQNYVDEAIYFTSDTAIVNSFRTRFDDQWVNTTEWANYANVSGPLTRRYGIFPKDPSLNFAPWENFRTRSVNSYAGERRKIDVIMYRITDRAHADGILAAVARGVAVRLITEPEQYRDDSRMWHAWNVDRLYMGGVQIKHRAHQGLNHQKSVILYDQDPIAPGDQPMVIFGSSNWTSPSASGQVEHNIFTSKPYVTTWFINQFERKWNNLGGVVENVDFVPLPPDAPKNPVPAHGAGGVADVDAVHVVRRPVGALCTTSTSIPIPIRRRSSPSISRRRPSRPPPARSATPPPIPPAAGHHVLLEGRGEDDGAASRSSPVWSFTTAGPPSCAGTARATSMATAARTSRCSARRTAPGTDALSGDQTSGALQWGLPKATFRARRLHRRRPVRHRGVPSVGRDLVRARRPHRHRRMIHLGTRVTSPVAGDYDGDRRNDIASVPAR